MLVYRSRHTHSPTEAMSTRTTTTAATATGHFPDNSWSSSAATAARGKSRHTCYNDAGVLCITVVDPATRKLLIPLAAVFETRAQHRNTLPSLCQLFLSNRCRQGGNCYQVHAAWEAVEQLRGEVDALPCCCVRHGDPDRAGVCLGVIEFAEFMHIPPPPRAAAAATDNHPSFAITTTTTTSNSTPTTGAAPGARCLRDVVLFVPQCARVDAAGAVTAAYIPLDEVSYTVALKKLLEEQDPLGIVTASNNSTAAPAMMNGGEDPHAASGSSTTTATDASAAGSPHARLPPAATPAPRTHCATVRLVDPATGSSVEKAVVDGTGCTVCRLHAMDRCRYAEECKFLHLCKAITEANPHLTVNANANGNNGVAAHVRALSLVDSSDAATGGGCGATAGDSSFVGSASTSSRPRRSQPSHHTGVSVFTSMSRQQQQQQQPCPTYPGVYQYPMQHQQQQQQQFPIYGYYAQAPVPPVYVSSNAAPAYVYAYPCNYPGDEVPVPANVGAYNYTTSAPQQQQQQQRPEVVSKALMRTAVSPNKSSNSSNNHSGSRGSAGATSTTMMSRSGGGGGLPPPEFRPSALLVPQCSSGGGSGYTIPSAFVASSPNSSGSRGSQASSGTFTPGGGAVDQQQQCGRSCTSPLQKPGRTILRVVVNPHDRTTTTTTTTTMGGVALTGSLGDSYSSLNLAPRASTSGLHGAAGGRTWQHNPYAYPAMAASAEHPSNGSFPGRHAVSG